MIQKTRTKNERHVLDDAKRKQALEEKYRIKINEKELIKNSLRSAGIKRSNKTVFVEDGEFTNCETSNDCTWNGIEKQHLFDNDSDGSEGNNYEINVKSQFEGQKGQKILALQSGYNNDERFKLDERFKDDDDDNCQPTTISQEEPLNEKDDFHTERAQQLKVLGNVLGQPIQTSQTKYIPKKSHLDMVRYDEKNEEHKRSNTTFEKYERMQKSKSLKLGKGMKDSDRSTTVSDKKFYNVSDELRFALKNRKSEDTHFSLLKTFSKSGGFDEDEDGDWSEDKKFHEPPTSFSRKENNSTVPDESLANYRTPNTKVHGIFKEKFFFENDDPRFEEGLSFINKKDSEEARLGMEKYDQSRRGIREILRLRWQKHCQRKNPFRKKIGGGSKNIERFKETGHSFRNSLQKKRSKK